MVYAHLKEQLLELPIRREADIASMVGAINTNSPNLALASF